MRRSHETNTLIIVSNHLKSIYKDRWDDEAGTLHYTGMGTQGDQELSFAQNKTLAESPENEVTVHWFEVLKSRIYTYRGVVNRAGPPYTEVQPDTYGDLRKVYVFPLKPAGSSTYVVPKQVLDDVAQKKAREAKRLSDEELERRARRNKKGANGREVTSKHYERDPWVKEHTLRRANGICQLCNQPAPFKKKNKEPYLETHHVIWLAKGGDDSVENTVALCPNCHRKMHVVNSPLDLHTLKNIGL